MLAPSRLVRLLLPSLVVASVVVASLVLAACGASTETAMSGTDAAATASATVGTGNGSVPAATDAPGSTTPPDANPDASPGVTGPSAGPDQPTASDAATSPGSIPGIGGSGPAAGCSGSDANRDFFAAAAAGVDWTVYCPVLPDGWFVQSGSYRLRDGGVLRIAYTGPNGARIELREGGTCVADPSCVPSGTPGPSAAFGDRTGTFLTLDGGGFAISVDGGKPVSWLIIGANLDEGAFDSIAAGLLTVGAQ